MTTFLHAPSPRGDAAPRRAGRALALIGVGIACGLLLSACGGDDDGGPLTQMPASATSSDASLESFALGQQQTETAEPFMLDNVSTFPTSDSEEPIAVP